jgi:hypothetical protein
MGGAQGLGAVQKMAGERGHRMAIALFDHLIGADEDRFRRAQAESPRGFLIDDEFEFYRFLDGQISRLGSFDAEPRRNR